MANTLKVVLTGDASQLNSALNKTSARLKNFGSKAQAIGSKISRNLTMPLTLVGGASVKLAVDFDKSMTKIESLVGIAGEEVAKMGDTAKQMATDTGRSASEAADALFFITSAGLEGSEAMDVLDASLQAAAVGLGDTATVADLATSAMNAYGSDTLGASDATDVLVAAVREGKLESSELAGAMGSVLPIASNMGVSFNEVGAAFAAMSRTGTNAAVASTQLRGILNGLLKPTKDAEDALSGMGLSSAGLRQSLKEDGLLATLEILKTNFEGNDQAAAKVFGNVRALSGVMDLLGAGVDSTREIFAEMNNVQGATATAFEATSQSASFQLQKALNGVRNSLTEVGGTLLSAVLPHIQKFTSFIQGLIQSFMNLNPQTQSLVLGLTAIAAALPAILSVAGALATALGAILTPAGLVVAALGAIATIVVQNWGAVKKGLVDVANYFIDLYNESLAFRLIIEGFVALFKTIFDAGVALVNGLINQFKIAANFIKGLFTNVGMIIQGAFTLDRSLIQEGLAGLGDALVEGVTETAGNVKDVFADIGTSGADNFTEAFEKSMRPQKIANVTEEGLQQGIDNGLKALQNGIANIVSGGAIAASTTGGTTATTGGGDADPTFGSTFGAVDSGIVDPETIEFIDDSVDFEALHQGIDATVTKMQTMQSVSQQMGQGIQDAFGAMGEGIIATLGLADGAFGAFLSSFITNALQFIAVNLAQSMGFAVSSAAQSAASSGPFAAFVLPALIAGATAAVSGAFKKIPKFADGGIVSTPTLGMFGEYTGARQNPEVVAPLNKLTSMIQPRGAQQVDVGGSFQIRGQDLVVALQRAETNRGRIK
ncbi:MAG: putative minor tail protein [Prokaryotic dsDNA virus sp.]|nr:MAG: putative minor tail protein [Prokaryotic dsDNA virus sp.]|tara:strand:- start:6831 stop:9320 length:2490 start_codon:yes stop_codon:yes gene_type:complete